ncbi:MAG: hypothetical protein JNL96_08400 [Planctomycetaceae bacterium]|nr:hypothetical protein [Planctomycetaceae bacterium]
MKRTFAGAISLIVAAAVVWYFREEPSHDIVVILTVGYQGTVVITEDPSVEPKVTREGVPLFTIGADGTCRSGDIDVFYKWHKLRAELPDGTRFPCTGEENVYSDTVALRGTVSGTDSASERRYVKFVVGTLQDYKNAFKY